jgi:hypothetical protein
MDDISFDGAHEPASGRDGESDTMAEVGGVMAVFAEVERIAGMPRGTIASKFLRRIVNGWIESEPGSLARWLDEHFTFEGDEAEQATIRNALFTAEAKWRAEAGFYLPDGRGISRKC